MRRKRYIFSKSPIKTLPDAKTFLDTRTHTKTSIFTKVPLFDKNPAEKLNSPYAYPEIKKPPHEGFTLNYTKNLKPLKGDKRFFHL